MCIVRGLYYVVFSRRGNHSLDLYMAFRTAPIMCSLQSMTSYSIQLVLMIYRYSGTLRSKEETDKYKFRMQLTYWGIFVVYLGVWFFVWRMSVAKEAIVAMDWLLSTMYLGYLVF
jgi:hypothetical protein